ncbi:MAG: hypothetical protein ACPGUD_07665 [Parashewanella sp.]
MDAKQISTESTPLAWQTSSSEPVEQRVGKKANFDTQSKIEQPIADFHAQPPMNSRPCGSVADTSSTTTPNKATSQTYTTTVTYYHHPLPLAVLQVNNIMGSDNPAHWLAEEFVEKVVLKDEDDLFLRYSKECVKRIKLGLPLPMIATEHTARQMLDEINQFLQVESLNADDRQGLEVFSVLLNKLEGDNYSYTNFLFLCFKFPLVQSLFFSRYANQKPQWQASYSKMPAQQVMPDFVSIRHLMCSPTIADPATDVDALTNRLNIIINLTKLGLEYENVDIGLKYVYQSLCRHKSEKIFFFTFKELPSTAFSFTRVVPISFVKSPSVFVQSQHLPCSFVPYCDLIKDLYKKSHIDNDHSFDVLRQFRHVVNPLLSEDLKTISKLLINFWFCETHRGAKVSIEHVQGFVQAEDYVASLDRLFDLVKTRWAKEPKTIEFISSELMLKGFIFFAFIYRFDHQNIEGKTNIDELVESEYQRIRARVDKLNQHKAQAKGKVCKHNDCEYYALVGVLNNRSDDLEFVPFSHLARSMTPSIGHSDEHSWVHEEGLDLYEAAFNKKWYEFTVREKIILASFLWTHKHDSPY